MNTSEMRWKGMDVSGALVFSPSSLKFQYSVPSFPSFPSYHTYTFCTRVGLVPTNAVK